MWNNMLALDSKNIDALNGIGTALMSKNQIDNAIAMFKKAFEYQPNNPLTKNNLVWAMNEKLKLQTSDKYKQAR
ncbi:hypothetical protein VZ94_09815 [Methylocucumis oryzae]|uniref:Uncharacterized protein n=2 Tax=Methylocucumis oryzae TaxID=1632867 RepID=A0A0F3IJE4_9GAMM|nr:hypothetical protein VZ94_09815 [Methylocucumis oryzae]